MFLNILTQEPVKMIKMKYIHQQQPWPPPHWPPVHSIQAPANRIHGLEGGVKSINPVKIHE